MLFNIIEKRLTSSTGFRDKLQFVNSMKRLTFDLTKISLLKCLISIYRLIAEKSPRSESFYRIEFGRLVFELWSFLRTSCSCSAEWKSESP